MNPSHLDLFSGLGGFSLAAELEGFVTIGFSEIENYACKILHHHWPRIPNLGDIRRITRDRVLRQTGGLPFIITGGVPCQPASCAGKRKGQADARWLWPEFIRVIGCVRPCYALAENPPAILGLGGGQAFNRIVSELAALGYSVTWDIVSAADIGAPHLRKRLWLLCEDELAHGKGFDRRLQLQPGRQDEAGVEFERRGESGDWPAAAGLWPSRPGQEQFPWEPKRTLGDPNGAPPAWQDQRKLRHQPGGAGAVVAEAQTSDSAGSRTARAETSAQPRLDGVLARTASRLDSDARNRCARLRCIGNSIVPACAQIFFRAIRQHLIQQ